MTKKYTRNPRSGYPARPTGAGLAHGKAPIGPVVVANEVVLYFQDFVPPQESVHLLQGAPAVAHGNGKEFDLHKKSIFKKKFDRQRRYGNNARG